MKNLYDFVTALCKSRDMMLEDLQKKLGVSRSTLYRCLRGISQITPEMKRAFIEALRMDEGETWEFAKFVSLSAFDQSLLDSRAVLDGFLFGAPPGRKPAADMEMVFYNNDKYLRTLAEVLTHAASFFAKENLSCVIQIVNCLDGTIYGRLADFMERALTLGSRTEVEHFVSLSEKDYLQNISSFIDIFPLMKYELYSLYFMEETGSFPLNDTLLVSFEFEESGRQARQYFAFSFYEEDRHECLAFRDVYTGRFLSGYYENLKHSYKRVIHKHENMDFMGDVFMELSAKEYHYLIKRNPCYDRIPYAVYESLTGRTGPEEQAAFLTSLFGKTVAPADTELAMVSAMQYAETRIGYAQRSKQIDVYSEDGLRELAETGTITDHLAHLPAFNRSELRQIFAYLLARDEDPADDFRLYITPGDFAHQELLFVIVKGYGLFIEYTYPERAQGLWKVLSIKSARLAAIFCDYVENHIPVNQAMPREKARRFLQSLLEQVVCSA